MKVLPRGNREQTIFTVFAGLRALFAAEIALFVHLVPKSYHLSHSTVSKQQNKQYSIKNSKYDKSSFVLCKEKLN